MKRPRLLLADDHPLVLAGLRSLLETECDVVGAVSDGRSLVEAASRLKPEVIVTDISLPLLNGIDAARQIKKDQPEAKILFLTMHANLNYLQGCSGCWRLRLLAEDLCQRGVVGRRTGCRSEPHPRQPRLW